MSSTSNKIDRGIPFFLLLASKYLCRSSYSTVRWIFFMFEMSTAFIMVLKKASWFAPKLTRFLVSDWSTFKVIRFTLIVGLWAEVSMSKIPALLITKFRLLSIEGSTEDDLLATKSLPELVCTNLGSLLVGCVCLDSSFLNSSTI